MARGSDHDVVRASELGQHVFCARAWWLGHVKGVQPANRDALERGLRLHRAHGESARAAWTVKRQAYLLFLAAGLAAAGLLLLVVLSR